MNPFYFYSIQGNKLSRLKLTGGKNSAKSLTVIKIPWRQPFPSRHYFSTVTSLSKRRLETLKTSFKYAFVLLAWTCPSSRGRFKRREWKGAKYFLNENIDFYLTLAQTNILSRKRINILLWYKPIFFFLFTDIKLFNARKFHKWADFSVNIISSTEIIYFKGFTNYQ